MIIKKKFDSRNVYWDGDVRWNKAILKTSIDYFNQLLQDDGVVTLQRVYKTFWASEWDTEDSCNIGWIKGKSDVLITYSRIENTSDFELTIDCYPIKEGA